MSDMKHYILYISSLVKDYTTTELDIIMKSFKENNLKNGITGLIIVSKRNVMQFIQGEKDNLNKLWTNIKVDNRHKNVRIILEGEIDYTLYSDWSLKYVNEFSEYDCDLVYIEGSLALQNKISRLFQNFLNLK